MLAVAEVVDCCDDEHSYADAVHFMRKLVDTPELTPSARVLAELESADNSFFHFALSMAESHRDYFASLTPLDDATNAKFVQEAKSSLQRQAEIEASDAIDLDEYLDRYFAGS